MKVAISLVIFLQNAFGAGHPAVDQFGLAVLNPEQKPGKFVLYSDGYEDQRFDVDLDGKIDFWRVKKDELMVDVKFDKADVSQLFIRKIYEKDVVEILYVKEGSNLSLEFSQTRSKFLMHFSPDDKCPTSSEPLKKELASYDGFENLFTNSIAISLIDESCKKTLGSGYNLLGSSLTKFLKGQDKISKCLAEPKFRNTFPAGKENDLSLEVLKTAYTLERAKLLKDTEKTKPLITCESVDERRGKQPGISTVEGGKINVTVADTVKNYGVSSDKIEHEMLHKVGLFSEASVKQITTNCENLNKGIAGESLANLSEASTGTTPASVSIAKQAQAENSKKEDAKIAIPDVKSTQTASNNKKGTETKVTSNQTSEVYKSAVNASSDTSANIPKSMTVAQTKIPSSEALSETIYTNHQKTETGISNAYSKSTSQSSGILATANNIAGAMNTQAAASLAQAKNQIREIASTAQATGTTSAVAKTGSTGGLISRNKIGADETVVESITLDSQKPAVATRADASSSQVQNSRLPASESRSLPSAAETSGNIPQAAGLNSQRPDSGAAQVNPVGSNQQVSLGASNQNTQRQPANVNRGNGGGTSQTGSQDEYVSFISQREYQETKQRLKDPGFIRQLETHSITIIDTRGNSYGARRGEVRFLDDEVRFVRQNKK
ncbi:hypothetical protein AZI86_07020 [Bdellovibrio bacteriovorus]|uniref:Uncharacterized protein n=1 Tax=Bdellovibrio bacteriovorus TaxID=959 RepID=A0A150WRE1_BDEBC|nr:hypothetical protein [Bdellovibrio bacteriovorus]KYG66785.1 hypothetical protein AZI86_07020 [Bdellovibrio bacteriovorus]